MAKVKSTSRISYDFFPKFIPVRQDFQFD